MSGEMMNFPDTAEEYMEQYKIVDSEEVYTNGAELVPIFRMEQWFEQHPEPHWIPCSAGLPKTNDPVNVTYVNHNPSNYYAEVKDKPYTATAHFHKGQWYWYSCTTQDLLDEYGTWIPDLIDKDVEILAWCKLPEPYKGVTT